MADTGDPIDKAVEELEELVDLATVQTELQRAIYNLLVTSTRRPSGSVRTDPSGPAVAAGGPPSDPAASGRTARPGDRVPGTTLPTDPSGVVPPEAVPRRERDPDKRGDRRLGFFGRVRKRVKQGAARGRAVGGKIGTFLGKATGRSKPTQARMGQMGGAIGGVVGGAAAAAVETAKALWKAKGAIEDWTKAAQDSNRQLAEVSGSMAAVMAERNVKEMLRAFQAGEAQAGSAKHLSDAEQERKDAWQPIANFFSNIWNELLTVLNEIMVPIFKAIAAAMEFIYDGIKEIADILTPGGPSGMKSWEELTKGKKGEVGAGGIAADIDKILGAAKELEKKGRDMMGEARAAAMAAGAAGGGFSFPVGAAPWGRP